MFLLFKVCIYDGRTDILIHRYYTTCRFTTLLEKKILNKQWGKYVAKHIIVKSYDFPS